jgi:hypothetical protein
MRFQPVKKEISVPGERIILTWKRAGKPKRNEKTETANESKEEVFDAGPLTGSGDMLRDLFLSSLIESRGETEGKRDGFVKAPILITNIGSENSSSLPLSEEQVKNFRISSTLCGEKTAGVLRAVPFFSHPIDIMGRSKRIELPSLRSLVKGGMITCLRIMGTDRMIHSYWEDIFLSLTPGMDGIPEKVRKRLSERGHVLRSEIGALTGMKGEELTKLIEECFNCGLLRSFPEAGIFHLGAPKGVMGCGKDIQYLKEKGSQKNSLTRLLKRLGPFSLKELSDLFSWPSGMIPEGLVHGIADGTISIGLGPHPPMAGPVPSGEGKEQHIWIWMKERVTRKLMKTTDPEGSIQEDGPFRNGDAAMVLAGRDIGWLEKEKVKSTVTSQFNIIDDEGDRAVWTILERMDRISVRTLEIEEYSNLKDLVQRSHHSLEVYSRMGYDSLRIEKILGVPAGDAAPRARDSFIEGGYIQVSTLKGPVLQKSPSCEATIKTNDVMRTMLKKQNIYPGHHIEHPLQVIETLGGISDRWEILSRTGSRRGARLIFGNTSRVRELLDHRWRDLIRDIEHKNPVSESNWDSIMPGSYEDITGMKDLSKRFGLHQGMMDQESIVWTFRRELERFHRINPPDRIMTPERLLVKYHDSSNLSVDEWNNSLRIGGDKDTGQNLVGMGFASEDPWGTIIPFRNLTRNVERKKSLNPRGVLQRAHVLRCAIALGAFRMEELMEYAPRISDISKVRAILKDLLEGPLELITDEEGEGDRIYRLRNMDQQSMEIEDDPEEFIIISPKDRMWRVISSFFRGLLTRGRGFIVLKGPRPVAHLIMRKMTKTPRKEEGFDSHQSISGKEYWMIKKAWLDPRHPRDEMMRSIRKKFFEFGLEVMTEDEKLKIEDLYREMDSREEKKLA